MRNVKNYLLICSMFIVTAFMIQNPIWGTETLATIADDGGTSYFKPEVAIHPSGDVYVAYRAHAGNGTGRSEVYLSKYGVNGKVSFVKNLSESGAKSYEPEIVISANGNIHTVWGDHSGDTTSIKYRMYNGGSWTGIETLGQVNDIDNIEDLRIAVDPSGNIFIVFMHWKGLSTGCKFISKYGNDVSFEDWPLGGRAKHPDVAADGNNVHVVCQYKNDGEYTIAYLRRSNQRYSKWENWIDLDFQGTQRPRMSLDVNNYPHVVFFQNFGSTRRLWYKKWNGSTFDGLRVLTHPNDDETYHFCDVVAVNDQNVLTSIQRGGWGGGKFVGYNWQRNGKWTGYSYFSKSYDFRPTKQSIDTVQDRFFAAAAFCHKEDGVYLVLAEEPGSPGGGGTGTAPTASFTFSPLTGHAPLDVVFDATSSSDSDGDVTGYQWVFGDGNTGSGATPTHRYETQGTYTITLTVKDNDGKTGTAGKTIVVAPPNVPPVAQFTFSPTTGLLPLTVTFDASGSYDTDGDIVQYEWDFGGEQTGSGRQVTYTFNKKGDYTVTLTVYDDDDDTATATGTVEVLGIFSPLNIVGESIVNRNLFTKQYVYKITWAKNPANDQLGAVIVKYNVYRRKPLESHFTHVGAVSADSAFVYYDRLGTEKEEYTYTVTSVDNQGYESDLYNSASVVLFKKKSPILKTK
jgi:PKD repeat protein